MKNYENFNENDNDKDKEFLLSQPYIDEYTTVKNKGKLNIRTVHGLFYKKNLLNIRSVQVLTYSTLFRFMLYSWLYKYTGKDEHILRVISVLNMSYNIAEKSIEFRVTDQMSNNNNLLDKYISKLIGENNRLTEDYLALSNLIKKKDIIFTEANFKIWYKLIYGYTKKGNESEAKVIDIINSSIVPTLKNARGVFTGKEDRGGVDVIAYDNKGVEKTIQVKYISKASKVNHYKGKNLPYRDKFGDTVVPNPSYVFYLTNTTLDLKTYNSKYQNITADFYFLYDEFRKTLYSINTKKITTMSKNATKKTFFINIDVDDVWFDRIIKIYNL